MRVAHHRLTPITLILGFVILIALWEIAVIAIHPSPVIFPPPADVAAALGAMLSTPEVWADISVSVERVIIGFAVAVLTGVATGMLVALSSNARKILAPSLRALRFVIPFAWLPIASLWFGIAESGKYFITWYAAYFLIAFQTEAGLNAIDPQLLKAARTLGANSASLLTKVRFPAAAPTVTTGLRLGLAFSWIAILAAELVNSTSGIGYYTLNQADLFNTNYVLGGMVIIGVVGFFMDRIFTLLQGLVRPGRRF